MLNTTHPDGERLSVLAGREPDAVADPSLVAHVEACTSCGEVVADLRGLQVVLAELPDLAPSRPLRLLPPVAEPPFATGAAGWVRRLFAPAMTLGAALALVGVVGTVAPDLGGRDSGPAPAAENDRLAAEADDGVDTFSTDGGFGAAGGEAPSGGGELGAPGPGDVTESFQQPGADEGDGSASSSQPPAERSPWPMVLFSGVTILIVAALLRWILVPRAG